MEKDIIISSKDYYGKECIGDKVFTDSNTGERNPKGIVHIYEETTKDGKKKLLHKSNLVVYLGREMLIQRALNVKNPNVNPTENEFICWFGLGDGGVSPADPLVPLPPVSTNMDLASPVMLTPSNSDLRYADYQPIAGIYTKEGYYKKRFDQVGELNPDTEASGIEFEPDEYNSDRWLVAKITTTIGANDSNGEQLSEAGLFSASSNQADYAGQFSLFARITFPSLIKTSQRRLIFVWYLFF